MAGLETTGSNPDVGLLYDINGLTATAPDWVDRVVTVAGEYGLILALVLLTVWTWWRVRRTDCREEAAGAVAAVVWAPLAAGIALLVNIPIRGFVGRPSPAEQHRGIEELVAVRGDFSFVSDHATLAMALAVGLFIAHRRAGLAGIALAVLLGFSRVYLGVHYPTDVIGGLALGTAVALLLSPRLGPPHPAHQAHRPLGEGGPPGLVPEGHPGRGRLRGAGAGAGAGAGPGTAGGRGAPGVRCRRREPPPGPRPGRLKRKRRAQAAATGLRPSPYVTCPSASDRAFDRALRAGPRHPQVQCAVQKRPFSTVVVRWGAGVLSALPRLPRYSSATGPQMPVPRSSGAPPERLRSAFEAPSGAVRPG